MVYQRKSLVEKVHSYLKDFIYTPLIAGGITLALAGYSSPAQAQTRETQTETFDSEGALTKPDIREPLANWNVNDITQKLEMTDFNGSSGALDYNFNDNKFDFGSLNGRIEMTFDMSQWAGSASERGITLARDAVGGTSYEFKINANPNVSGNNQFTIVRKSPGLSHTYFHKSISAINKGGTNTIAVVCNTKEAYQDKDGNTIDQDAYTFIINGTKVHSVSTLRIPLLDGFMGMAAWDSTKGGDDIQTTTYFDDFTTETDAVAQGGSIKRQTKNLLKGEKLPPYIPDRFIRGDANMDKGVNISDPIYTLNHLFGNTPMQCADAMDANDDGNVDISDAIHTLFYLFAGKDIPAPNIKENPDGTLTKGAQEGMDITADKLPKCNGYTN